MWDAVLPQGLCLDRALPEAVDAVVAARALTAQALRALATPAVARTYLSIRANCRPQSQEESQDEGTSNG